MKGIIPVKDGVRMADYAEELESKVAQDLGISLRMYRQGDEVLGSVEREVRFARASGTPVSLEKIVAVYKLNDQHRGIVEEYAHRIVSLYDRNVQGNAQGDVQRATANDKALGAGAAVLATGGITLASTVLYGAGPETFMVPLFVGAALGGVESISHSMFDTSPFTELVRLAKSAYSTITRSYTALFRPMRIRALRNETRRLLTLLPEEKDAESGEVYERKVNEEYGVK